MANNNENFTDFSVECIKKHGALLIGDKEERENTVKYLLEGWDRKSGPLVVLDTDGRLYGRYGGKGLLVDFTSANSVIPDAYGPILSHSKYGRTPERSAKLIADTVIRERKDKNSNDAFWSQIGRQLVEEYVEYALMLSQNYRREGSGAGSAILDFGRAHELLYGLMSNLISRGAGETERWQKLSLGPKPDCPLTPEERKFQAVLTRFFGEGTIPFDDTIAIRGRNWQGSTQNSIFLTAQSNAKRFFEFNQTLRDAESYYKKLPLKNLGKFVAGKDENLIFVVNGADRNLFSTFACLTLLGCAAAADGSKKQITCLVPDISLLDTSDGILKIKEIFPDALKLIIGCGDFTRAARRTDMERYEYFDRLFDASDQNAVWHKSQDEFLKKTFKEHTAGVQMMYGLGELGGDGLAAVESEGEAQYVYIPQADEAATAPASREKRADDCASHRSLWYYNSTTPRQQEEESVDIAFGPDENDEQDTEEEWLRSKMRAGSRRQTGSRR